MGKLHKLHGLRNDTLAYAVFLLLMFIGFTGLFMSLRYAEQRASADDTTPAYLASFIEQVNSTGTYTALDPSEIPACAGNPECFAFTIDTRFTDNTGNPSGADSSYFIPTWNGNSNSYNWTINWGDGSSDQVVTGQATIGTLEQGVPHTYATPGQYQITIRPSGAAARGWLDGYGPDSQSGGPTPVNRANCLKLLSIDTPFTALMRGRNNNVSFGFTFAWSANAIGIPSNLFSSVSTTGDTTFAAQFQDTFREFAQLSTVATIPAGLFDFIDSSAATAFNTAFGGTFRHFATLSERGNIPPGLFDSLDTSRGTVFNSCFGHLVTNFAQNSPTATIPPGLFDKVNTSNGTNFQSMFTNTFDNYGRNSTTATVPSGLFDSLDTSQGTVFVNMFNNTFLNYGTRTATFVASGAAVDTQNFAAPYNAKNISRP
jgi:hypothetical protein